MTSLVFLGLAAQGLVYADEGFGIRLFLSSAWTVTEKREDDPMVLVHLEKDWLKAMLIYGIVPDLLGQPDPSRFLMNTLLDELGTEGLTVDPITTITVAGLVGCQTNMNGKMDGDVGVARIISLTQWDRAIIILFGREGSPYFLSQDIRDMEEFTPGLRLGFGLMGY